MQKKQDRKRLPLPRETVRTLRTFELHQVAGAMYSSEGSCWPAFCDPESNSCP